MKINTLFKLQLYISIILLSLKIDAQDIINKNDGSQIKAKVIEINTNEVKFKRFDYLDGPTVVLPISELSSIKYPNGSIESFKNNDRTSTIQFKSDLNQLLSDLTIKRDTIIKTFYSSGELLSETPYVNGKINGIQKLYYKSGKIISETTFKDGLANGKSIGYHKDGSWMFEIPYIDGNITGTLKHDKIKSMAVFQWPEKSEFVKNKLSTKTNRTSIIEIPYSNGIINGIIKVVYERDFYAEITYVNNLRSGPSKLFKKDGQFIEEEKWEDGEVIKDNSYIAGAVIQGVQGGVAYYNMETNKNNQTVSDYTKVVLNNVTKNSEDAIKENNKILEKSASNSQNSSTTLNIQSESSAITSSGKDGNSDEGIACGKEAKSIWESSKEYLDFYNNRNNINSPQLRNGELAKAKYAEILLQHCSQYLSAEEKATLTTTRDNCLKNANDMKGNSINPK